ncbi:MAG: alkaline phosphatase family protein [Candidatus Bathyarchaeota archaeon]|uniref:alkaline phosphatase family protein n=1 Tax=Candidatus Bathycorpusculum sp. TaxID=2994959 RepID=UPI00283992E6|nr:alkaline phosphatase family protein [Candidatus Termiticorpusculum sp.]MCL2291499.1 alkaline phosphatase family protein [Candidatus Termiticorpusculum sp.]
MLQPQQSHPITKKENNPHFTYPQYQDNCISNIPDLLKEILEINNNNCNKPKTFHRDTAEHNKKVILLVIDGLGYNQFLNQQNNDQFLTNLNNKGIIQPLTSVFPSQTTNALTTLNTGLTPQEHGLFEHFIYLKNIGIINSLNYECINPKTQKTAIEEDLKPNSLLLKGKTIHTTLREKEIQTYTHTNIVSAFCACSKTIFQGSTITPALKTSDLIVGLRKNLEANKDKSAYFFVHIDTPDTLSHKYGPNSEQYYTELTNITYLLNKELVQKLDPKTAKDTLLLLTADHGGIDIDTKKTVYLTKTALNLQIGANQEPIAPTGSYREIFLHIEEKKLAETKQWLHKKIGEKAQIIETLEATKNGLFGIDQVSKGFFERAGNLLILPYNNQTIWFKDLQERKIDYLGQHGGLSRQEMIVPFAVTNIRNLKEKIV